MYEDLRCPKCGASNLIAQKRGFNAVKGVAGGLGGGVLLGPLGALAGGVLAGTAKQNELYLTCLTCQHRFAPAEAGHAPRDEHARRNPESDETAPAPLRPGITKIDW